jgi:hypothetical protein
VESVDVYIKDSSPNALPIEGVLVRVFNQAGAIFYTQGTTNSLGLAGFSLPEGNTYQLRYYKQKVGFTQPQYAEVLAGGLNAFEVVGDLLDIPTSTNPRLCRCYGFFRRPDNSAAAGHDMHIITKFNPMLLDGDAVLTERIHTRTNEEGYVEFDLIRNAHYDVTVEGFEDCTRHIEVPDAPSCNIPALFFPIVSEIQFDPPGPWTLATGVDMAVTTTVITNAGQILDGAARYDIRWSSEDSSIAVPIITDDGLTIRAVSPGTTQLLAVRSDNSIIVIPDAGIVGQPVDITVT